MPALFAGGVCWAVGAFEAGALLAGAEGAGVAAGLEAGAAGVVEDAAGAGVVEEAPVLEAGAEVVAADAVDFLDRLFLGAVELSVEAATAAGVVADEPAAEAEVVDFLELDFFGVAELSDVAVLPASSVFFVELFFFAGAEAESGAA